MAHESDHRLLVLHGLRLKGVAGAEATAEAAGLPLGEVQAAVADLAAEGRAVRRQGLLPGWSLTAAGRDEHTRLVGRELDAAGARAAVTAAYERFRVLNAGVLDACSRWQARRVAGHAVRNDHADPAYDRRVVADLAALHRRVEPVCHDLAGVLARFRHYGPRLRHALSRVEAGDGDWFTKPVIPSYHTVWFELHEDLLITLGTDRTAELGERQPEAGALASKGVS